MSTRRDVSQVDVRRVLKQHGAMDGRQVAVLLDRPYRRVRDLLAEQVLQGRVRCLVPATVGSKARPAVYAVPGVRRRAVLRAEVVEAAQPVHPSDRLVAWFAAHPGGTDRDLARERGLEFLRLRRALSYLVKRRRLVRLDWTEVAGVGRVTRFAVPGSRAAARPVERPDHRPDAELERILAVAARVTGCPPERLATLDSTREAVWTRNLYFHLARRRGRCWADIVRALRRPLGVPAAQAGERQFRRLLPLERALQERLQRAAELLAC